MSKPKPKAKAKPKKAASIGRTAKRRTGTSTSTSTSSRKSRSKDGAKAKSPTTTGTGISINTGIGIGMPNVLLPPTMSGRPLPTLIIDTGGWTVKHDTLMPNQNETSEAVTSSTSTSTSTETNEPNETNQPNEPNKPKLSYNVIAKPKHVLTTLTSNEINTIQNKSNLIFKRPLERGYTIDLGIQFQIWDYILQIENLECHHSFSRGGVKGVLQPQHGKGKGKGKSGKGGGSGSGNGNVNGNIKGGSAGDTSGGSGGDCSSRVSPIPIPGKCIYTHTAAVFCLHQPFTPRNILEKEDEIWFRDFGFGRIHRMLGVCCSAFRYLKLSKEKKKIDYNDKMKHTMKNMYMVNMKNMPMKYKNVKNVNVKNENMENMENMENVEKMEKIENRKHQNKKQQEQPYDFLIDDDETGCCCVIDSGFSVTHVVPTVDSRAIAKAIRRINVGGKLLTNLLKEIISYRQWNMMDEFYNINDAKEALCYVSTQFEKELKYAREEESRSGCRIFDREFVLPDYSSSFQGIVRIPLRLQMMEAMLKDKEGEKDDPGGDSMDVDNDKNGNGNSNIQSQQRHDTKDENGNKKNNNENINNNDDGGSDNETEDQTRQRIMKQREEDRRRRELEEEERQALLLSVERFTVPEILFRPSDIEMKQIGLAEAIVQSIEACDPIYRAAMYHNIVLTGGNVKMPNFKERLETELRFIAPINYKIRIHLPRDPVAFAFEGAQDVVKADGFVGGLDRAEWEVLKQSGKVSDRWCSKRVDGDSSDGFIVI